MKLRVNSLPKRRQFENSDIAYATVTRFTIHSEDRPNWEEWCARRAEVFETRCLPPMLAQRLKPHVWAVLCDETPTPAIAGLIDRLRPHPWIAPVFVQRGVGSSQAVAIAQDAIRERLAEMGAHYLCTARLDSDDSVEPRYFAALDQAIAQLRPEWGPETTSCLNFLFGVLWDGERMVVSLPEKQFFAMVEPFATAKGPYQRSHTQIDQVAPVVNLIIERPMFIYHRHDAQISKYQQSVASHTEVADPLGILTHFGIGAIAAPVADATAEPAPTHRGAPAP